jgi:hypothetical protein
LQDDADLAVFMFNSNSISYLTEVDDPMFSAHKSYNESNIQLFSADRLGTFLGCKDKYQFLNPILNKMSPLASYRTTNESLYQLGFTERQAAAASRIIWGLSPYSFGDLTGILGPQALRASESLWGVKSTGLPNNQWELEVMGWFDTHLAYHQGGILNMISRNISQFGPYADLLPYTTANMNDTFCRNQIIRNAGQYQSFSVLGLCLIGVVGFLIILISFCIEPLVKAIRSMLGRKTFKSESWITDFVLQQQRIAFEAEGMGTWSNIRGVVPLTERGELLSERVLIEKP